MTNNSPTVPSPEFDPEAPGAFGRSVSVMIPAHIVRVALLFAMWAVAARVLTPAELGTFVLIAITCDALILIADFGMTSTIVRDLASGVVDQRHAVSVASAFLVVAAVAVGTAVYFAGDTVFAWFGGEAAPHVMAAIALLFICQYCQVGLSAFLQGLRRYRAFAVVQIVDAGLRIGLVVVCLVWLDLGLRGFVFAVVAASGLSASIAYLSLPWIVKPRFDLVALKRMLRFGMPLQAQSLLGLAFERTDVLLIGSWMGAPSVAAYDVAYKGPNQFRGLFSAFRSVFFPHMAAHYGAGQNEEAGRLLRSTLRALSCLLAGATLVAALFGREIVSLVFSPAYAASGPICALLMAGVSIGVCNFLMGLTLIASGNPGGMVRAGVPEAAVNIAANVILIPAFGLYGAAAASILSRAVANPIFLLQLPGIRAWPTATCYLRSFFHGGVAYAFYLAAAPMGSWAKVASLLLFAALSMKFSELAWADITFGAARSADAQVMKAR